MRSRTFSYEIQFQTIFIRSLHQRKVGQLRSLQGLHIRKTGILLCALYFCGQSATLPGQKRFFLPAFLIFLAAIFVTHSFPITSAGPSNSRYGVFVKHFRESTKMFDKDAILQIRWSCNCEGEKLNDKNQGQRKLHHGQKNGKRRQGVENVGRALKTSTGCRKQCFSAKSVPRLYMKVWTKQVVWPSCQTSSSSA